MRAAFVTAAIAAVVLPLAATPIPGEGISKMLIMPSMDTSRLLDSRDNKPLDQTVSVLRPEPATHVKENHTTSVNNAEVGVIGVAIANYTTNAGKSVKRDQVRTDYARGLERYDIDDRHYEQMTDHNVSDSLAATAAFEYPTSLADAQVAAVIAAGEASSPPASDSHTIETDMHQLENIFKATHEGLSLDEIHELFHSFLDDVPINPSDEEVDDFIRAIHHIAALDDHGWAR